MRYKTALTKAAHHGDVPRSMHAGASVVPPPGLGGTDASRLRRLMSIVWPTRRLPCTGCTTLSTARFSKRLIDHERATIARARPASSAKTSSVPLITTPLAGGSSVQHRASTEVSSMQEQYQATRRIYSLGAPGASASRSLQELRRSDPIRYITDGTP